MADKKLELGEIVLTGELILKEERIESVNRYGNREKSVRYSGKIELPYGDKNNPDVLAMDGETSNYLRSLQLQVPEDIFRTMVERRAEISGTAYARVTFEFFTAKKINKRD